MVVEQAKPIFLFYLLWNILCLMSCVCGLSGVHIVQVNLYIKRSEWVSGKHVYVYACDCNFEVEQMTVVDPPDR